MTYRNTLRHVCCVLILLEVVFPRDVHAYLDPGTGSLVFQTLVAALAAVAYGLRTYWGRIRTLLSRNDPASSVDRNSQD